MVTKDGQMTFRLPADLKERLEELATEEGRKAGDYVYTVLARYAGTDMVPPSLAMLERKRPLVAASITRLIELALDDDAFAKQVILFAAEAEGVPK